MTLSLAPKQGKNGAKLVLSKNWGWGVILSGFLKKDNVDFEYKPLDRPKACRLHFKLFLKESQWYVYMVCCGRGGAFIGKDSHAPFFHMPINSIFNIKIPLIVIFQYVIIVIKAAWNF